MMIIKFSAHNQRLRRITSGIISDNASGKLKFEFDFRTDDWDMIQTKMVNFYYKGENYQIKLDAHNQCFVPSEVIFAPSFAVSVYGGNIVTNEVNIPVDAKRKAINDTYEELMRLIATHKHEEYVKSDDVSYILQEAFPDAAYVTLYADKWVQADDKRWYQVVNVSNANITPNSKVDLQPDSEQLAIFHQKDLAFVAENEDGVISVYCVGQVPTNDYTIQTTVTEVVTNG